jgi:hypothetical protein
MRATHIHARHFQIEILTEAHRPNIDKRLHAIAIANTHFAQPIVLERRQQHQQRQQRPDQRLAPRHVVPDLLHDRYYNMLKWHLNRAEFIILHFLQSDLV